MNKTNTELSDIQILIDRIDTNQKNELVASHKEIKIQKKVKYDEKVFEDYIKRSKKSKRNSKIHFRIDKFRESKKKRSFYGHIKYELEKLQLSTRYQWLIIFLVGLDCFCIGIELLIEFIELSLIKQEYYFTKEHFFQDLIKLNDTYIMLNTSSTFFHLISETSKLHKTLFYLENFFKYLGTSILGLFIIEFVIKAIFIPMNFFIKIWEFIDAVIVLFSFTVNIYLFKRNHAVHSIIGLITLLRLWRITEIINGNFFFIFNKTFILYFYLKQ